MEIGVKAVPLENGYSCFLIVDLGGIVHVIVEGLSLLTIFRNTVKLLKYLGLRNRDAVGVVWYQKRRPGCDYDSSCCMGASG